MKHKFRKNMCIINDLLSFCHFAGATNYHVDFGPCEGGTFFKIKVEIPNMRDELLNELNKALLLPHTYEVEQNYWELSGDSLFDEEIVLAGMMLDEAIAIYENDILTISARRLEKKP